MSLLLLVDDDPSLLDVLTLACDDEGHDVVTAVDGMEALQRLKERSPDLVISDVNMPRLDGFGLCRRMRAAGHQVPLILLTSRDDEIDHALGLDLGADDYVTKPFSTRILLARVAALLRREALRDAAVAQASGSADAPVIRGSLLLDPERIEVRWGGAPVRVTVSEFRLLEALIRRPGVVLSRAQLLDQVRGSDSVVADRIIDSWVRRLRRKIEAVDDGFDRIETVVGAGYRWRDA
jgi:DNA-binding response OmpR family regulator